VRKGDEPKYRFGVQKTWGSDPRLRNKRSSGATKRKSPGSSEPGLALLLPQWERGACEAGGGRA